jgi:hypothetical protein
VTLGIPGTPGIRYAQPTSDARVTFTTECATRGALDGTLACLPGRGGADAAKMARGVRLRRSPPVRAGGRTMEYFGRIWKFWKEIYHSSARPTFEQAACRTVHDASPHGRESAQVGLDPCRTQVHRVRFDWRAGQFMVTTSHRLRRKLLAGFTFAEPAGEACSTGWETSIAVGIPIPNIVFVKSERRPVRMDFVGPLEGRTFQNDPPADRGDLA